MKRVVGFLMVVGLLGACNQDSNVLQELESLAASTLPFEGHCDGTQNSRITCDPEAQLEWLDLTETAGKTIREVESKLVPGGPYEDYRYATYDELNQLVARAGITLIDEVGRTTHTEDHDAYDDLHRLLGILADSEGTDQYGSWFYRRSNGFLNDTQVAPQLESGIVRRLQVFEVSNLSSNRERYSSYWGTYTSFEGGNSVTGHFLVKEAPVTTLLKFGGLQEPYAGPSRSFKLGSVVPLKWQYKDANGVAVASPDANPKVSRSLAGGCVATDLNGPETLTAPGTSSYQYDANTMTWQFNLATKGLAAGCHNLVITSAQAETASGMQLNLRK